MQNPGKFCTKCGSQVSPDDAFCAGCGKSLQDEKESSQAEGPVEEDHAHQSQEQQESIFSEANTAPSPPPYIRTLNESLGKFRERIGASSGATQIMQSVRAEGVRQNALMGTLAALICAVLVLVAMHLLLFVGGVFGVAGVPSVAGFAGFALAHGGAVSASAELALSGLPDATRGFLGLQGVEDLGGHARLGIPLTSLVLLPLVVAIASGWLVRGRVRNLAAFVLVSALVYAVITFVIALIGTVTLDIGDLAAQLGEDPAEYESEAVARAFSFRYGPGPFSTAAWGFLWFALGAALGSSAGVSERLSSIPPLARRLLLGTVAAVAVSVLLTIFMVVVGVVLSTVTGGGASGAPEDAFAGSGGFGGALTAIFVLFLALPALVGNLWLFAHGVPLGYSQEPDFSSVPLVSEALAGTPLSASLIGAGDFSVAWRLLLLAPVIGLVVGGIVTARRAPAAQRWWNAALVALPYSATAILAAALFNASAEVDFTGVSDLLPILSQFVPVTGLAAEPMGGIAEEGLQMSLGARAAWMLLYLPLGAAFAAAGGLALAGRRGLDQVQASTEGAREAGSRALAWGAGNLPRSIPRPVLFVAGGLGILLVGGLAASIVFGNLNRQSSYLEKSGNNLTFIQWTKESGDRISGEAEFMYASESYEPETDTVAFTGTREGSEVTVEMVGSDTVAEWQGVVDGDELIMNVGNSAGEPNERVFVEASREEYQEERTLLEEELAKQQRQYERDQRRQQAAGDIEEMEVYLGELLYGDEYESEPSLSTQTEAVQNDAIALEENLEAYYGEDVEEHVSDADAVLNVLEDYRDGKQSQEDACFDLVYDRSDFSQFDGITDDSEYTYREDVDVLEDDLRVLDNLIESTTETFEDLQAAKQEAGNNAPDLEYDEAEVDEIVGEAKDVRKEANNAMERAEQQVEEYEGQAESASTDAVAAYDEMGITNEADCYDLSEDNLASGSTSGGSGTTTASNPEAEDVEQAVTDFSDAYNYSSADGDEIMAQIEPHVADGFFDSGRGAGNRETWEALTEVLTVESELVAWEPTEIGDEAATGFATRDVVTESGGEVDEYQIRHETELVKIDDEWKVSWIGEPVE